MLLPLFCGSFQLMRIVFADYETVDSSAGASGIVAARIAVVSEMGPSAITFTAETANFYLRLLIRLTAVYPSELALALTVAR